LLPQDPPDSPSWSALEHKVDVATDRIIFIGACAQKLRDIRDDLDVVKAKLSVLPNVNADVRSFLLRSLQEEVDSPRLQEVRYLLEYFECLRRVSTIIRQDILNSSDISEWPLRHALKEFEEMWRQAEEEDRRRAESDVDE